MKRYLRCRLGQGDDSRLLCVMMRRSFGAESFTAFWQYWNPVYGYCLYRLCYRPLHRFLPRAVCVVATFAASGFLLHDLPFGWGVGLAVTDRIPFPFVTVWFVTIGLVVSFAEMLDLSLHHASFRSRVLVNAAHVFLPFVTTLVLSYVVYAIC